MNTVRCNLFVLVGCLSVLVAQVVVGQISPDSVEDVEWQVDRGIRYASIEGVDPNLLSLDVYSAKNGDNRDNEILAKPILIMIHGGGWRGGDKSNRSMWASKAPHFVKHGFVYISINYRLSNKPDDPKHPAHVQDVARAIAWVSDHAVDYGGDGNSIFLMGHSAGAHLAALVATDHSRLQHMGKRPTIIKGTICLDSAAYDIPRYVQELGAGFAMRKLYNNAFGREESGWRDASPWHHVTSDKTIAPMLFFHTGDSMEGRVLSGEMVKALRDQGTPAKAINAPDKNHRGINVCIGTPNDPYTKIIMQFLEDPARANLLSLASQTNSLEDDSEAVDLHDSTYNPLRTSDDGRVTSADMIVRDSDRDRDIPLRVYLPSDSSPAPVILFSHGLGGNRYGSSYLGKHWAKHGYAVVYLQHPGSDDLVWTDVPVLQRMNALKEAASLQNLVLRTEDVTALLNQLELWNKEEKHPLHGRLDLETIGMSGHSFGAVTTQYTSGQSTMFRGTAYHDTRIDAALALSPSIPARGAVAKAFQNVDLPWMLMTGTHDGSPIGKGTAADRRKVYTGLPNSIHKYELVLNGAEHSAFSERALPGENQPRNPHHHQSVLALSTAFWDAHLRSDAAALQWLHSEAVRKKLDPSDEWQSNAPSK